MKYFINKHAYTWKEDTHYFITEVEDDVKPHTDYVNDDEGVKEVFEYGVTERNTIEEAEEILAEFKKL